MDIIGILLSILLFCWEMLVGWLGIFYAPIQKLELFWILIPIWLSWFFAEFFQEKKGTSFGNATSNGVVPLFVGFDWIQYLVATPLRANIPLWVTITKYAFCVLAILYGLLVIYLGIRGNELSKHMGRIREVTYILVVFTPVIYGVTTLEWQYFLQIIIFFPAFYFLIEWIDKIVPDPTAVRKDTEDLDKQRINSPRDIFDSSGANYNEQNQNFNQNPTQMRNNENTAFGNSMNDNMFK